MKAKRRWGEGEGGGHGIRMPSKIPTAINVHGKITQPWLHIYALSRGER